MSNNDSIKLFSSIKYFTTGFADSTLETTFKQNGASRSYYLTETTTHVICDDFESNKGELEQAIELYQTPIVTTEWIRSCLKCHCLLPTEPYRTAGSHSTHQLFHSCVFTNANVNINDQQKLYALVTFYGGRWISNIDNKLCTHIICSSALPSTESDDDPTNDRLHDAYEIQSDKLHLITPDWIIDSLNENRLLSETDYHPDLLRDPNEPMDVDEEDLDDEINDEQTPTKSNTTTTTTTTTHRSQLISKNFFNQSDQTTPPPSAEPSQIPNENPNPSDSMETSQTKVAPPKRSRVRATGGTPRSRNTKVNAAMNNNNVHLNQNGHPSTIKDGPTSTLPIEEKLIRPSVSSNFKSTHLFHRNNSIENNFSYELNFSTQDKHELIPSSQCLLGCVLFIDEREYRQTVSNENLSSWSKILVDHGAIVTDDIQHPKLTHFVCAYRTSEYFRQVCKRSHIRLVTAHWLNDVLQRKKLFVPNLAIHFPSAYEPSDVKKLPLANYFLTLTGFDGIERARLRFMIRSLGGKYSTELTRWHSHLIAKENNKSEKLKRARLWSINVVNGVWLSELYLGNTWALKQPLDERYTRLGTPPILDHFSFDQIFVHDFLQSWSQPISITDEMLNSAIHRHNDQQIHSSFNSDLNPMKLFKENFHYDRPLTMKFETNENQYSIMLSGFDAKTNEFYQRIIESLGGQVSVVPHATTHLVMNQISRTEKFYQCLNFVRFILKKTWLDKCQEEQRFVSVDENDWLTDENYSLKRAIEKRHERENRPLFSNYSFFLTPSLQPSIFIIRSIIYSAGGNFYRHFPTLKQLTNSSSSSSLIITCNEDKILMKDFDKFNSTDVPIKLVSIEFLLESIRQQEIVNIDSFLM